MAVQWTMWRELTCLSSLEQKTLCIPEPATEPGTFIGRDQGLGGCWWHKYCCAFNCWQTKYRTWFVREDGKGIQKFFKSPENKSPKNQQTVTAFALIFSILFYLESRAWALKRKSVSTRIIFTQAWVMVLGQKLMGEILWPVWYKMLERSWWSLWPFKSRNHWLVDGNQTAKSGNVHLCLVYTVASAFDILCCKIIQRWIGYSACVWALSILTERFLHPRLYHKTCFRSPSAVSMADSTLSLE